MSLDRTAEFRSLAASLPVSAQAPPPPPKSANSSQVYADLRSFHSTAAGISKDIAGTSKMLQELALLVRNQSIWDDAGGSNKEAVVNQLVVRIKTNMESLNARLDETNRQLQRARSLKNSQAGQEANNLVQGLQTEFAHAGLQFKDVLQSRTDRMKEKQDFRKNVYGSNKNDDDDMPPIPDLALSAPPPVYRTDAHGHATSNGFPTIDLTSGLMAAGEPTGPTLPRPHTAPNSGTAMRQRRITNTHHYSGGSSSMYDFNNADDSPQVMTPLDLQRFDEESGQGQMQQLIPDQDYLQQRANAMTTVESQLVELGSIFNKLAVMVNEHQDLVQRVEDNVQDANDNLNLSLATLTDTLTNLRSNRALAMRLMAVLVTFIIIFIVGFA